MTLLSVRFVVATLCLTSLAASSPARAQAVRPRSTSELLIDSARDVLVSKRGAPSAADLAHARALLGAAQRLDPAGVDAAAFRFELESLAGDVDAANEALDRLIEVDPDNDVAQARRLARGPVGAQSRESAQKWYENALEKAPTPVARALAHVKLAELAMERLDRDAARKHAEEARTLCPDCAEPAAVLLDLLPADAAPVERIAAILAVLRTNPLAVEAAWQAAFLLDDLGLFADAEPFYGHAFRAHAYKTTGPPPLDCLLRAAENAYLRGQTGQAGAILTTLLADEPPEDWERLLRLGWLSEACGMRDRGRMLMKRLAENAARCSVVPDNATPENDAYAAWYYAFVARSGEKALPLAESAVRRAPDNTVAIRALGWAQSMVGKTDEARTTLASIATRDAASAARLAGMLRDSGDPDGARRVLNELRRAPHVGIERQLLEIEGYAKPTSQPAVAPEIASLLSAFDRGALEILAAPEKYFDVAMEIENADPDAAEPWRAAFSITSKAKFPIPLGADGLINPVFLLSFRADADKMRDFPALFAVTLDRRRYLPPGETIRAQRTLDVGPLHTIARRFPQQAIRVEIQAIFDPGIQTDGRWSPSAMGRALRPAALTRRIVDARGACVSARLELLLDKYPPKQFVSIEVLSELLGERQRYELRKLSYAPLAAVSTDRIMAALRGQLQSESWEARVRTLDALQSAGLDAPTFAVVQNCLQHSHWLVRFAAVRLLARQGESFKNEAAKIAESDSDALVREIARAALLRWVRPESQPAPVSRPADDAD